VSTRLIAIGGSAGGLAALKRVLAALPGDAEVPVAVVLHRAPSDARFGLEAALQRSSALPIVEPEDKEPIVPGHVYVAPPDYHLLVEHGGFALSTEGPVNHARPSIDVLLESAVAAYRGGVAAAILTGRGRDGAAGLARVRAAGGTTIVQDPTTAASPEMPAAAAGAAQRVLPLEEIGPVLSGLAAKSSGHGRRDAA
jgi:two-component system chemotaxis response regulator CheB